MSYLFDETDDASGWGMDQLPGDVYDNAKMQASNMSSDVLAWTGDLIKFGVTKLIDNRTGPVAVAGNSNPGSFAGSNGRTYPQDIAERGSGTTMDVNENKSGGVNSGGISPMMLLLLAGVAFLALKG